VILWRRGETPETSLLGLANGVKTCRVLSKRGSPVQERRRHPARSHLLLVVHLMWEVCLSFELLKNDFTLYLSLLVRRRKVLYSEEMGCDSVLRVSSPTFRRPANQGRHHPLRT